MERQSFEIIESGNTAVKINWAINTSSSIGVSDVPWNIRTRYKSNQNGAEMIYHQNKDTQFNLPSVQNICMTLNSMLD